MSDFKLDTDQVRRNFSRAAVSYEDHDVLQREVQDSLLARLDFYLQQPQRVIDIGAGTGRAAALLKQRYPTAEVIALDFALPMLQRARQHSRWRRRFARVAADAMHLPLPNDSVDVINSNLCVQWCDDLPRLFTEWVRVLKPGGYVALSSFGPDTLRELRAAWADSDHNSHVGRFLDMHDLGDAMLAAGLREPVLDVSRYTLTYDEPGGLLRELKGLGATHADSARPRGLTGKKHLQRMLRAYESMRADGRIPATWEVISAHAWGPQPGQPLRTPDGGEVASFSIDNLRNSRPRKTP
ncbi:MAG: malonyl-ACP O-methyltransferase BioC [Rhodanobacteraceae bacterium]